MLIRSDYLLQGRPSRFRFLLQRQQTDKRVQTVLTSNTVRNYCGLIPTRVTPLRGVGGDGLESRVMLLPRSDMLPA